MEQNESGRRTNLERVQELQPMRRYIVEISICEPQVHIHIKDWYDLIKECGGISVSIFRIRRLGRSSGT